MSQIILVVEDDEDLRNSVETVLVAENYTVHAAFDGRHALDILEQADWRPDLIVSDIAMPRMDGYDFFVAVHEVPALRAIPFIFLTARGTKRDIRMGRQLGADDYLIKPFEPDEFLAAIQNKLKRAAEMRAHAAHQLDSARRTLVQLLSHELRTPLTYVTGGFSLLAEELSNSLSADAEISLSLIRSGTHRLNRLAEQMVLYAELDSGHIRLQLDIAGTSVAVKTVIESIIGLHHQEADEKNINLIVNVPEEPLHVFGLADQLVSALSEVVRNAISYSAENSNVWINAFQDGSEVVIEVVDHGRGIIPQDIENIWRVMIQSERPQHEQQGAGMGLPIVRKIVEAHQGSVSLESVINEGTRVTIRLPLYNQETVKK